jgi:spore coat protein H
MPLRNGNAVRRLWGIVGIVILLSGAAALAFLLQGLPLPGGPSGAPRAGQLFDPSTVWTARLRVERDPWDAMEPTGGRPPFGMGGPGSQAGPAFGPAGPPAPLAPPVPPADFGPGTFVAPIFMQQGDENHDRRLSLPEIRALAGRWFTDWDKDRAGKLNSDQLRDGLNVALLPQGPPPGFGSPGSPGGGPPGINFLAPDGKRNGVAGVMGIDFVWVRAAFEIAGRPATDVDVRWKGNGTFLQSRGDLKRSFKVRFSKGTAGRKLGDPDTLNFHSNVTDASLMNETLAYRLFRDAGVPAPRTGYARVYLTVPGRHDGTYMGVYSIVENIDNRFTIDRFGTNKGTLFKPVARRLFEDLGDQWEAYRKIYDPKTPISDEAERRVIEFCKLVSHAADDEFDAKLDRYLDLDEFSRFMAVTVWLSTLDSILAMDQNYVVYLHPKRRRSSSFRGIWTMPSASSTRWARRGSGKT